MKIETLGQMMVEKAEDMYAANKRYMLKGNTFNVSFNFTEQEGYTEEFIEELKVWLTNKKGCSVSSKRNVSWDVVLEKTNE